MAYGFNEDEEAARESVRRALYINLPWNDYNLSAFMKDPLTIALCDKPFKRERIVREVTDAFVNEGFVVQRTATVKSGRYTYTYIEVEGIAVCVGSAKRGGQGIFVYTVADMDERISASTQQLHQEEAERVLKEQIKAKLNDDELKFLGWTR